MGCQTPLMSFYSFHLFCWHEGEYEWTREQLLRSGHKDSPKAHFSFRWFVNILMLSLLARTKEGEWLEMGSACDRVVCGRCGGAVTFSPFFMYTRGPVSSLSERSITFLHFNCYHYSHHLGLFGVMLLLHMFFLWYVTHAAFPRRI